MPNVDKLKRILALKEDTPSATFKELERIDGELSTIKDIKADRTELDNIVEVLSDKITNISLTPGKDGLNGMDGKDGRDGIDGQNGKDGLNGKDGIKGIDGIDGKDGLPDTLDQVIEKIHKSNRLIKKEKIEGFDLLSQQVDFAINRPIQGIGGGSINFEQMFHYQKKLI